ncbi:beta-lactamase/transpeptidase-like protein [Xylariaceae sp. FL1019]|nr:beta-lactamase/transpeptidase-like protein [Xylariaceae sp. FL1019]
MIMKPFEEAFESACANEEIPGAVLLATNGDGSFSYGKAFGKRSVRAGADQSPLKLDSVMWIASCTKVITSLAALQCVERGLLTLDGLIYDVLPELKHLAVIKRFADDGSPVLVPHSEPITLRRLLNHSSGLAYDETHPKLLRWHKWHRTAPSRADTVETRYGYPLVFEPGDSWCYGAGVDWAGVAVERVNGTSLQRYFDENIFSKVGARDIVFSSYLHTRPDLQTRLVDQSKRDPNNPAKVIRSNARAQASKYYTYRILRPRLVMREPRPCITYCEDVTNARPFFLLDDRGGCFGGLGLYSTPVDYMKVVAAVLTTDEDQKLLSRAGVDEFFRGCLTEKAKAALNKLLQFEEARIGMGSLPKPVWKNWGLGGIVNEDDVPGGRHAGTMTWTGLPNLSWFVDRNANLCGLYAGQLYPPADPKVGELFEMFEKGIYYDLRRKDSSRL